MIKCLSASEILPDDPNALMIGRVWSNEAGGPCPVLVDEGALFDLSDGSPTISGLLNLPGWSPPSSARLHRLGKLDDFLSYGNNSGPSGQLLAPCDLQAVKAAGVTFAESMLERVIEERARGEALEAERIRDELRPVIGDSLRTIVPGSAEAKKTKELLLRLGYWSQYLEVGIGPDAEIFTKAQPLSSVGCGSMIGINRISHWNNPEPEVVLVVNNEGTVRGAMLGNDVNLRDVEGRSALLLGKAKDNNGSCAIGPFIRLFDPNFTMKNVEALTVRLAVTGEDGFDLHGENAMEKISRAPADLVLQTINSSHQYPDGFLLFLGTMFSPVKDRVSPGLGFTHRSGDEVRISCPELGTLVNWVAHSDEIAPWTFGANALMTNLANRGLL